MKKSFTLIELLIVLVIIGILATLAIPQYNNYVEKARWAGTVQMLGSIRRAASVYHDAYGKWPPEYINEGMTNTQVFEMLGMADPNPPPPAQPNQFHYTFWGGGQEGGAGGPWLICLAYKDLEGDGGVQNSASVYDPHIWVYGDGTLSSRAGAPEF